MGWLLWGRCVGSRNLRKVVSFSVQVCSNVLILPLRKCGSGRFMSGRPCFAGVLRAHSSILLDCADHYLN
jgi:hypothetical protein